MATPCQCCSNVSMATARDQNKMCSLQLVEIYTRIVELDPAYKACKDASLKGRFAKCVRDDALQRELCRLNVEAAELTFFAIRDRAIRWMGKTQSIPSRATTHETQAECVPPAVEETGNGYCPSEEADRGTSWCHEEASIQTKKCPFRT